MNQPVISTLFAAVEMNDIVIIAVIVTICAGIGTVLGRQRVNMGRIERKLDAIMKSQGVQLITRLSPNVQRLARDPSQKIQAIRVHRQENPGLGLAEAKEEIEDFLAGSE